MPGSKKRVITLRRSIFPQTSRNALEEIKCGPMHLFFKAFQGIKGNFHICVC